MPPENSAKLAAMMKGAIMGVKAKRIRERLLVATAIGAMMVVAAPARADDGRRQEYNIEVQSLGDALRTVSRQSGREIIFSAEAVVGKQAPPLRGNYSADEAVRTLLAGSDLSAEFRKDVIIIRGRSEPSRRNASESTVASDIVVTGSRIRGATTASPVIALTREGIRTAGMSNVDEAIRSIPQNFGGGQNPGVAQGVPERNGANYGSGSSINLRGLGQDATLTLLNGHRLAYNSAFQGIDVSTIPLAAVDRIEIVADGASAVYGSDAVAGVANIVLSRDFDGLSTASRLGASTDGGNEQQQYSAVGGKRWSDGGLLLAYEFAKTTPVIARQRDYTLSLWGDTTILPAIKRHNGIVSGHQMLASNVEFKIDALYNWRESGYNVPFTNTGDYRLLGSLGWFKAEALAIAPSLKFDISGNWSVSLTGVYAQDNTDYGSETYQNGSVVSVIAGTYHNTTNSLELGVEGKLFELAGGPVRIASGVGYRNNDYVSTRVRQPRGIDESQGAKYAFAELNFPLIGPSQDLAFAHRLTVNLAARHEDYDEIGKVTTPKIGVIYSPVRGISLKGSWGRSYKAPQFYQQYSLRNVTVYDAGSVGGSTYPAGSSVLFLTGGNPNIGPERATTWTATASLDPELIPNASFELSYFHVNYRNRVVSPFPSSANALSNPVFGSLVALNPSATAIAGTYSSADQAFNASGRPYDPASVVAIVNGVNRNASSQEIQGVDLSGRYSFELPRSGRLTLQADASYIESKQRLSDGQPLVDLSGTIFNPPHFRARGGASFDNSATSGSLFINYIGGVTDNRTATLPSVSSMTTIDISARHFILGQSRSGPSLEISATVQNLFNDKPEVIAKTFVYATPFDSTNYSAVGRFVSVSLTKRW